MYLTQELAARVDLDSDEGRAELLNLAKPLVMQVKTPALAVLLRKKLAELARLSLDDLDRLWGLRKGLGRKSGPPPVRGGHRSEMSPVRWLIRALLLEPVLAEAVEWPAVESLAGEARTLAELAELIQNGGVTGSVTLQERLRETALGEQLDPLWATLLADPAATATPLRDEFVAMVEQFYGQLNRERVEQLTRRAAEGVLSESEKRELGERLRRRASTP